MTHTRKNRGVCSRATTVTLSDDGKIEAIQVEDGCDGNLAGLCLLLKGMHAKDAMQRLGGISCEGKPTSCPDQISLCLAEALEK